jgi:ribosome-binding protein aMBF1 (putative translation factor)
MTMWFRKVVKCDLCSAKVRKKDTWQLHMNTAEGPHKITVCNDCAKTMNQIKENVGTWLEQ